MRWDHDRSVGSLRRQTPSVLADKVAWILVDIGKPRAVTCDPDGHVWVEFPHEAAEADLPGVYDPAVGALALTRMIRDDLLAAAREVNPERHRVVRTKRALRKEVA